jgi:hypothetical protein
VQVPHRLSGAVQSYFGTRPKQAIRVLPGAIDAQAVRIVLQDRHGKAAPPQLGDDGLQQRGLAGAAPTADRENGRRATGGRSHL